VLAALLDADAADADADADADAWLTPILTKKATQRTPCRL
jgi:hypothetical protein